MRPGRIAIINVLGLLIVLIIAGIAFYLWHQSYYFYSTNDAVVSGYTASVASLTPGQVTAIRVQPNQTVSQGQAVVSLSAASSGSGGSSGGTVNATSPLRGTVLDVTTQPGQFAPAGQPLAQVADLSRSYITAYVDETHISDIHPQQGVDVHVDAYPDIQLQGTVQQIVPATASTFSLLPTNNYASGNFTKVSQRVPVIITLDGTQGKTLLPNTSASVTIHIHN